MLPPSLLKKLSTGVSVAGVMFAMAGSNAQTAEAELKPASAETKICVVLSTEQAAALQKFLPDLISQDQEVFQRAFNAAFAIGPAAVEVLTQHTKNVTDAGTRLKLQAMIARLESRLSCPGKCGRG